MSTVASLMVKINGDMSGLDKTLQGAKGKLQQWGGGMQSTGMAATKAFTLPIVAGGAVIATLAKDAMGYQNQMNEIFTLMPDATEKAMGQMSDDVLQFAKDMGVIPEEVAPALYQAISAGVPPDNVFAFLETAQKAAVGGVTDLTTAVDGISTVVNAYGNDVIDAATASDLMFTAVRLGKTTFEELSASLFQTLPTASALGVGFEDVAAAMATMTAQGVPTSVATTQMRQMLVELSKEGGTTANTFEDLAGKSFKDFIASGGDVSGALALMQEHAEKTDVNINDLFSSVEAGNAALALGGENAQGYIDNIEEMQGAAGATDAAFQQMENGVARQMEKLKAEFNAAKIEIGDKFLPIITETLIPIFREQVLPVIERVAEFIKRMAERFAELDPKTQKIILGAIALVAALGPVLMIVGMMVSAIGALIPVFAALLGPIGLVIAIIAGLVAAGIALYQNWDEIKAKAFEIWGSIKDFFANTIDAIKSVIVDVWESIKGFFVDTWESISESVVDTWNTIKDFFVDTWESISESAVSIWESIKSFFVDIWESIKTLFGEGLQNIWKSVQESFQNTSEFIGTIWNGIKDFFTGIWDNLKTTVVTKAAEIYTSAKTKFEELWGYIKSIPAQALQWGKDILNNLWEGMKSVFASMYQWFQDNVVGLLNKLNPWARHSPSLIDNIRSGVQEIENLYGSMKLPEAVFQTSVASPQMSMAGGGNVTAGGSQTIIVELDGRQIARTTGPYLAGEIRVKQGLR